MTTPLATDPLFARALAFVLSHEGGLSEDPDDPGGVTRWGISLGFLRRAGDPAGDIDRDGDVDADDVRAVTHDFAADIYRRQWWDRYGYARINDPGIAVKIFDLAVNMGPAPAHRCLQRAVRACWFAVADDGVFGPKTLAAVNAADPRLLMAALKSEAAGHYRALIAARPSLAKYERGWANRAYDTPST